MIGHIEQFRRFVIHFSHDSETILQSGRLFYFKLAANTKCLTNVGLMLIQRLRRWINIKPTLGKLLWFAGWKVNNLLHVRIEKCLHNYVSWGHVSPLSPHRGTPTFAEILLVTSYDVKQCVRDLSKRCLNEDIYNHLTKGWNHFKALAEETTSNLGESVLCKAPADSYNLNGP